MAVPCPRCSQVTWVRLGPGEVCPQCSSDQAWTEQQRLVVTHADVEEAVARRERGEAATEAWGPRVTRLIPSLVALGVGATSVGFAARLLARWEPAPLDALMAGLQLNAWGALGAGLVAVVLALVAHLRLRRTRLFRSLPVLAVTLSGFAAGLTGSVIGFPLALASGGLDLAHTRTPDRAGLGYVGPQVSAIVDASVVIIAPSASESAWLPALGAGSVIARDGARAWVLTCSHVVTPYAAIGAWRDPRRALPVWVELADGRSAIGTVRWTARPPLDVAVVEVPLVDAPQPVTLVPSSVDLVPDAEVTFVPNPLRDGWLVHRGRVTKRELHTTPAGAYSLLYSDLPVQQGDSGSGLFDARGRLVGLNTWTRRTLGGWTGISLPSETMRAIVELVERGDLDRLDEIQEHPE